MNIEESSLFSHRYGELEFSIRSFFFSSILIIVDLNKNCKLNFEKRALKVACGSHV